MQTFLAKWNGQETTVQLDQQTSSVQDLKLVLQAHFGLQSCKLAGLKRKHTNAKLEDTCKLIDCLLQPLQKILVIGSKTIIENEEKQIAVNEDMMEEETNYENIVSAQTAEIWRKVNRVNALKHSGIMRTLSSEELVKIGKVLCHEGDEQALKKYWEPDMSAHLYEFAKFAVRSDKWNMICFLKTKGLNAGHQRLLKKASKYGHLNMIVNFVQIEKTQPLDEALCEAIKYGHLRVASWLKRNFSGLQADTMCLLTPCARGYVKIVAWFCEKFSTQLSAAHYREATVQQQNEVVKVLLKTHCCNDVLTEKHIKEFSDLAIKYQNLIALQMWCAHGANIDNAASLLTAIERRNFDIVEYIVQHMQTKRGIDDWHTIFGSDSLHDIFISCIRLGCGYPDQNDEDIKIAIYLLRVGVATDFAYLHKKLPEKNQQKLLQTILTTRHEQELFAEYAATQLRFIDFPVDVNRIVLEYSINSDGRSAKKFLQEKEFFFKLCN